MIWLPAGEGRICEMDAGARGYVLSIPDDVMARTLSGYFLPGHVALQPVAQPPAQAQDGKKPDGGEADHSSDAHQTGLMGLRCVADSVHGIHLAGHREDFDQVRLIFAVMAGEIGGNRLAGAFVFGGPIDRAFGHSWPPCRGLDDTRLARWWPGGGGSVTLHRFLQVLEIHFRDHWNVADYARALGTSERRLALTTLRGTGKPPQALAQVAYGLRFRDPAYFNRFFKRYLGVAPGAWRRKKRAGQIRDDTSFVAWP